MYDFTHMHVRLDLRVYILILAAKHDTRIALKLCVCAFHQHDSLHRGGGFYPFLAATKHRI
jgi:hypothetical protein